MCFCEQRETRPLLVGMYISNKFNVIVIKKLRKASIKNNKLYKFDQLSHHHTSSVKKFKNAEKLTIHLKVAKT